MLSYSKYIIHCRRYRFSDKIVYPIFENTTNPFKQLYDFQKCNIDNKNELCEAGFTYTGEDDIVKCDTCGLQESVKSIGNDPYGFHFSKRPNCERAKSLKPFLNALQPTEQELYNRQDGIHRYPTYKSYDKRFSSFSGWAFGKIQGPTCLVKAGLFSNGEKDQVICYSCGLWLAEWESDELPLVVHARHSPHCAFLKETLSPVGIAEIQRDWRKTYVPLFSHLEDLKKRVDTFYKISDCVGCNTPESLAEAGFFAEENYVKLLVCHYCGVRILPWKSSVNPWEMHIRWCKTCKFVETRKGRKFISLVYKKYKESREKIRNLYDNPMVSSEDEEVMYTWKEIKEGICIKCKKRKVTTLFQCGHRITCKDCASTFTKCPYCRTPVTKTAESFH